MVSTQPKPSLTAEEYLAIERDSEERHEFFNGEMFEMGGASEPHNLIVSNICRELGNQLKETPCRAYVNDMRVKVDESGLYTYPDFVVVCEPPRFEDEVLDTLLNPLVIGEVLSKSTENYDRGKKFEHYRKIPTLKECLLIAQDEMHVEHFVRQDDGS